MVPHAEPVNRKILIINNERSLNETIRQYLSDNSQSPNIENDEKQRFASGEPEYLITTAERGDEGAHLALEAEMAGRPFALAFIGESRSPDFRSSEIIENIWRDCPDMEIVLIMSGDPESALNTPPQIMYSDQLMTIRPPLMYPEIQQMARLLTGKWSYRHVLKQSYEKMFQEQKRRQSELENNILRLQQEIINQRRKFEIIEGKFLRYKDIFDHSDYPLIVTSGKGNRPFGKILDVNKSFCRMTGFSPLELKGMEFGEIFEEDVVASATHMGLRGNLKTRIADSMTVEVKSRRIGLGSDSVVISAAWATVYQPVI